MKAIGPRKPRPLLTNRLRTSRVHQRVNFLKPTVPLPNSSSKVSTGSSHQTAMLSLFQLRPDIQPTLVITLLTALSQLSIPSLPRWVSRTPIPSFRMLKLWLMLEREFKSLLSPAGRSSVVAQTLPSVISSPWISHLLAPGMVQAATLLPSFSATTPKWPTLSITSLTSSTSHLPLSKLDSTTRRRTLTQ